MVKIERKLHKLDAQGQAVGRLASQIAVILRGKNKVEYQPYLDMGDLVLVTNLDKLSYSGKKMEQKVYHSYSGYPGGLKTRKIKNLSAEDILKRAVREMLPKNKHRINMLRRITISTKGGNK
jgi:large subunit ribosomal protein L13